MLELDLNNIPGHLVKYFKPKHKQWILRNDIVWGKRNSMPESVTDRFSKKHEYIFFMVKSQKYYFDLDGIRDKHQSEFSSSFNIRVRDVKKGRLKHTDRKASNKELEQYKEQKYRPTIGKNPGSVSDFWDVPTQPSSEKHYASFNTQLIDKPIIAGCPKDGIILDPFCGTGTTLIRALQLERKFIGIDGSKDYCKIANKRIQDELDQYKMELK